MFSKYILELPTNAALETRDLADRARLSLKGYAEYMREHQPLVHLVQPPSSLGMRLARGHTFYADDSGMASMMSRTTEERPFSAEDVRNNASTYAQSRETTMQLLTDRSGTTAPENPPDRQQPTGRSVKSESPSKIEREHREKTVIIGETVHGGDNRCQSQCDIVSNTDGVSTVPNNVMSVTHLDA